MEMLVLSRQKDETIEASMTLEQLRELLANVPADTPPDAVVFRTVTTVVEIRGSKTRLGIHAPPQVQLLRGEIVGTAKAVDLRTPVVAAG
jgi:sRNA-binding carbon storage regulator CsrA